MTVVAEAPVAPRPSTLWTLTARELARMAANPVVILLTPVLAAVLVSALHRPLTDVDGLVGSQASLLGGFGMMAAFWTTTSTRHAEASLGVAPISPSKRTVALCLSTAVPLALGLLSFLAILTFQHLASSTTYGLLSPPDRTLMLLSQTVLPAVGGPLLGIALARWWPGPWVPVTAFLLLVAWTLVAEGVTSYQPNAAAAVWLRLFAPFALFISSGSNGAVVQTWRGSIGWFVCWQVALCLLAITVALLRDANPQQRIWLRRTLGVVVLCALTFLALAATGGLSHALAVDPSGHVVSV